MQKPMEQSQQTITDHPHHASHKMITNINAVHDIILQIGIFQVARAEIYQKTFEKMAGITDLKALLSLQQDFFTSSMDNLLSHTESISKSMVAMGSYDQTDNSRR